MPTGSAHLLERFSSQRAELDQAEEPSARDPGLSVDEAAAIAPGDDHVDRHRRQQNDNERRQHHEQRRRDDQIEGSFRDGASISSASGVRVGGFPSDGATGPRRAPASVLPPTPRTKRSPPAKPRPSRRRTSTRS